MQILAMVELHPEGLPSGWVRELAFRKTKDGSVRRDPVNKLSITFLHLQKGTA
jgi:hypothetical protein